MDGSREISSNRSVSEEDIEGEFRSGGLFGGLDDVPIPDELGGELSSDSVDGDEESSQEEEDEVPRTLEEKAEFVVNHNGVVADLFGAISAFSGSSSLVIKGFDGRLLRGYVDFTKGYRHRFPKVGEKIWMMPEYGYHGVPLVWFDYGFRLPMHPFFLRVYEAIGCGIAQLAPNTVVQISGLIARCAEKEVEPSLGLLFSIYKSKYCGGQIYFDKQRKGLMPLVRARSSNFGWHGNFTYLDGVDLNLVGPWRDVPHERLKDLNDLPKMPAEELRRFCGLRQRYDYKQFGDYGFLESHNRKAACGDCTLLLLGSFATCLSSLLLPFVVGETLQDILETGNMISEKTLALLAKKAVLPASSHVDMASPGIIADEDEVTKVNLVSEEESEGPSKKRHRGEKDGHSKKHGHKSKGSSGASLPSPSSLVVKTRGSVTPKTPNKPGVLSFEIGQKERWAVGKKEPIHIFKAFSLPQDDDSYAELGKDELADRSMRRLGRFISDFNRILGSFKDSGDSKKDEPACDEIVKLKEKLTDVEKKLADSDKAKIGSEIEHAIEKKEWSFEKVSMQCQVEKLHDQLNKMKLDLSTAESVNAELVKSEGLLRDEKIQQEKEIDGLTADVKKFQAESVQGIEAGFRACFARFEAAGAVVEGLGFESYCADLAKKNVVEEKPE